MNLPLEPEGPPLTQNEQGVWRIAGTRVSVKSLLYGYLRGSRQKRSRNSFPPFHWMRFIA